MNEIDDMIVNRLTIRWPVCQKQRHLPPDIIIGMFSLNAIGADFVPIIELGNTVCSEKKQKRGQQITLVLQEGANPGGVVIPNVTAANEYSPEPHQVTVGKAVSL